MKEFCARGCLSVSCLSSLRLYRISRTREDGWVGVGGDVTESFTHRRRTFHCLLDLTSILIAKWLWCLIDCFARAPLRMLLVYCQFLTNKSSRRVAWGGEAFSFIPLCACVPSRWLNSFLGWLHPTKYQFTTFFFCFKFSSSSHNSFALFMPFNHERRKN